MTEQNPRPPEVSSTGELVARLGEQVATLVRDELRLAQAEMSVKAQRAGTGAGLVGAGGMFALFGLAAAITTAGDGEREARYP